MSADGDGLIPWDVYCERLDEHSLVLVHRRDWRHGFRAEVYLVCRKCEAELGPFDDRAEAVERESDIRKARWRRKGLL